MKPPATEDVKNVEIGKTDDIDQEDSRLSRKAVLKWKEFLKEYSKDCLK